MVERLKSEEQEARALAQREANARAAVAGEPLPFPGLGDVLDPTKVRRDATEDEIEQSVREFRKICQPRPRKVHRL